jgi:hypothetical protein
MGDACVSSNMWETAKYLRVPKFEMLYSGAGLGRLPHTISIKRIDLYGNLIIIPIISIDSSPLNQLCIAWYESPDVIQIHAISGSIHDRPASVYFIEIFRNEFQTILSYLSATFHASSK